MVCGSERRAGLDHAVGPRVEHGPPMLVGKTIDAIAAVAGHPGAVLAASADGVSQVEYGIATLVTKREALPIGGVQSLLFTRDGVWLAGRNSVSLVGPKGMRTFVAGADLPGTQVVTIAEDRDHVVWIGTNSGLARFWNGEMQSVGSKGDSARGAFDFRGPRRRLMGGHRDCRSQRAPLANVRDSARFPKPRRQRLSCRRLIEVCGSGPTARGVIHLPGKPGAPQTYAAKEGLASNTVLAIGTGKTGDVWAGTPDGLSLLHEGHWQTFTSAEGLADDLVRSVLVAHDGAVWV